MKQSLDLKTISSSIGRWFDRFHTIIFFLFVGISLIFCIYVLLTILNASGAIDQANAEHVDTQFDTQTMDRVNELKSSSSDTSFHLPPGRTNPFVE